MKLSFPSTLKLNSCLLISILTWLVGRPFGSALGGGLCPRPTNHVRMEIKRQEFNFRVDGNESFKNVLEGPNFNLEILQFKFRAKTDGCGELTYRPKKYVL